MLFTSASPHPSNGARRCVILREIVEQMPAQHRLVLGRGQVTPRRQPVGIAKVVSGMPSARAFPSSARAKAASDPPASCLANCRCRIIGRFHRRRTDQKAQRNLLPRPHPSRDGGWLAACSEIVIIVSGEIRPASIS